MTNKGNVSISNETKDLGRVLMRDFSQKMQDDEAADIYGGQTYNACRDAGGVDTFTAHTEEGCDFF